MATKVLETQGTIPRAAPPDYAAAIATQPQEAEVLEHATAWIPDLPTTQTARYTRLEVSVPGCTGLQSKTDDNRNRSSSQG